MQVAFYVARANAKHPNSVRFESMKLKFRTDESESRAAVEQRTQWAKAVWAARLAPFRNPRTAPPAASPEGGKEQDPQRRW